MTDDSADLDSTIEYYEAAIAAAPDESLQWLHPLGLAYQERAALNGDLADWDSAIHLHRLVADVLPLEEEDRDQVLAILADAHRARFHAACGQGFPESAAVPAAREAAGAIARIDEEVFAAETSLIVRAVYGLVLVQTYGLSSERSDLDDAVGVLEPVLDRLDPDAPFHNEVCADLCRAYTQRALLDGAPADLDLAIATGRRAADGDDPDVNHALGCAYQVRWDSGEQPDDLDRAIDHWLRVIKAVPDPGATTECARLLGQRAQARSSTVDLQKAIELFSQARDAGEPCAWYLGMALWLRYQLLSDRVDIGRAADLLDEALAADTTPEWQVSAYPDRLALAKERLDLESVDDSGRTPPGAADMLRLIDQARAVFETGAGEPDDRGRLAALMAAYSVDAWQAHPDRIDAPWLAEMTEAARTANDAPSWKTELQTFAALARHAEESRTVASLPGGALEMLLETLRSGGADPRLRHSLGQMTPMFLAARAIQSGDQRMVRAAVEQMLVSDDAETRMWGEALELTNRAQHGDLTVKDRVGELLNRLRTAPISYVARQSLLPFLTLIHSTLTAGSGRFQPVDRTPIAPGDQNAADKALQAMAGPVLAAITRHDVVSLRQCADRLDELIATFPERHLLRLVGLGLACFAGTALLRNEPGDQDVCRRLLRWTDGGLAITGGPYHPRWSSFALARAAALREVSGGSRPESRRWGLAGLQGFAWQVMLQAGTDDAVLVAADAGAAAHRVAGWCRADGAVDDLIAALETGRALVLQAATTSRTIADRLVEAGEASLAERWRSSAGYGRDAVTDSPLGAADGGLQVPDELRSKVMHLLHTSAPAPVTAVEIRQALGLARADALVYLIPSGAEQPGAAVVIPTSGTTSTVVLSGLATTAGSTFDRHRSFLSRGARESALSATDAAASHRRAERDVEAVEQAEVVGGLDGLCQWAWTAAMGPVLRHVGQSVGGRPARLVLVPTGALSSVPWHAAYRPDPGGRRYAVEDAVVSYAISGRAFIESAREPARDVKSVLVVGDPTGDLPFAGVEARAIGRVFYPHGTALGVADGTGTPQQVLDWIATAAPGPSLLHLACHGHADPAHPADACLRLAGGDLTARSLLEASRIAELEIERVFLAACATGVAGADHDEAFSLSTAFLAAGAGTVFGSLWKVPDDGTSLLMFLVHHFLNDEGCAPVDALRRAQLWMLDPDRVAPPKMPPELVRHCSDPHIAEPRSWAAFTHQGR
jgi:tetratricopeptide (TPR) repeat protein